LGGYALLNLDAQYQINKTWRLLMKLDNALDKDYQTAQNFNSQPVTAFVGLRWTLDR
jgi:vitamin B12 transporter